jgi:hypothetical protein
MKPQEWQQDAGAKRKTMILVGAVVIAVLWLWWGGATPKPLLARRPTARTETAALAAKPAWVGGASVPVAAPPVAVTAPPPVATGDATVPGIRSISGVWQGQGIVPKRSGSCSLIVELRDNPAKEGTFRAFTTLGCPPFLPLWQATHPAQKLNMGALWLREMSTTETILTGSLVGESLVFSDVVETASTDAQGCALESIDLRSFGNDQLLAKWREGQCEGGELVLRKVKK